MMRPFSIDGLTEELLAEYCACGNKTCCQKQEFDEARKDEEFPATQAAFRRLGVTFRNIRDRRIV